MQQISSFMSLLLLLASTTPSMANNFACSNPYGGSDNYQCFTSSTGDCQCFWNGR